MATRHRVKVKLYRIVLDAVEAGVAYGYNRAHKYADKPSAETIKQYIEHGVMNELCGVINFEDD